MESATVFWTWLYSTSSCKFEGSLVLFLKNFELDFGQGLMEIILSNDKTKIEKINTVNWLSIN